LPCFTAADRIYQGDTKSYTVVALQNTHDDARSWFDGEFLKSQPAMTAFMFCGTGDARSFDATMAAYARHKRVKTGLQNKSYYFTLAYLKASALARDLIIFYLS
jgi:hypothetical protein